MSRPRKIRPGATIARTTKQRTPTERALHAVEIAKLYLKGKTQAEIARQIGISQQLVSYDLRAIREIWVAHAVQSFDQHLARELAKLDQLEATYWEAWERSLRPRSTTKRSEKSLKPTKIRLAEPQENQEDDVDRDDDPDPDEAATTIVEHSFYNEQEESTGNAEFLRGIERCIEKRIALLGLNAPVRTVNAHVGIGLPNSTQNEAIARQLLGDDSTAELINTVRARLTFES